MLTIELEDAGAAPPPPPIYIGKSRGSKKLVDANLHLTIECDAALAQQLAARGAILWLRGPLGPWYDGKVPAEAFAGGDAVTVQLRIVEALVDPVEIRMQPAEEDLTQSVELSDAA